MLKVLLAMPEPPPLHGGSRLTQELLDSDLSERVKLTFFDTSSVDFHELTFLRFPGGGFLHQLFNFTWTLVQERPDIFHTNMIPTRKRWLKLFLYLIFARLLNAKTVVQLQLTTLPNLFDRQPRPIKILMGLSFRLIDVMFVRSHSMRERLDRFSLNRIDVLPLGLGSPATPEGTITKNRDDRTKILYLNSVISIKKGIRELLRAAGIVQNKTNDNVQFMVAVRLPTREDGSALNFDDLLSASTLKDSVRYLGFVDGIEKWKHLIQADLFVLPSYRESFSFSALEAMSVGTPVISTPVSGLKEHFVDTETIYFVPKQDERALAETLQYVIQHPDEAKRVGKKARKFILENLMMEQYVNTTVQTYEELMNDASSISR